MLDAQLITQEDYEREKKSLLSLFTASKTPSSEASTPTTSSTTTTTSNDSKKSEDSVKDGTNTKGDGKQLVSKSDFRPNALVDPTDESLVWCGFNISFPVSTVSKSIFFINC